MDLLKDFSIEGTEEIDIMQKERIFRNCLAHGRYTLSMDKEGTINVIFDDPTIRINDKNTRVRGSMSYGKFRNLASIYISAVNIEKTEIIENPQFEHRSMKNYSVDKIFQTFFASIQKNIIKYKRNFDVDNDLEEAIQDINDEQSKINSLVEYNDSLFVKIYNIIKNFFCKKGSL